MVERRRRELSERRLRRGTRDAVGVKHDGGRRELWRPSTSDPRNDVGRDVYVVRDGGFFDVNLLVFVVVVVVVLDVGVGRYPGPPNRAPTP